MNHGSSLGKFVFITLVITVAVLGIWFAYETMHRYDILIRGLVGLALLYSLTRLQFSSIGIFNEGKVDFDMGLPEYIRFLLLRFLLVAILFWSLQYVVAAGEYLINVAVGHK